jgi:hypothetical protein
MQPQTAKRVLLRTGRNESDAFVALARESRDGRAMTIHPASPEAGYNIAVSYERDRPLIPLMDSNFRRDVSVPAEPSVSRINLKCCMTVDSHRFAGS